MIPFLEKAAPHASLPGQHGGLHAVSGCPRGRTRGTLPRSHWREALEQETELQGNHHTATAAHCQIERESKAAAAQKVVDLKL